MAIPTFYHADLTPACREIELTAAEAQHARAARRLQVGQEVLILNGLGLQAQGKLSVLERHKVLVQLSGRENCKRRELGITVYTAVPKGDRQRVLIEGLTQLGVQQIVPLRCEYSASTMTTKMLEKWRRYAIEAIKQSQNPWLPSIGEEITLSAACAVTQGEFRWYADVAGHYFSPKMTNMPTQSDDRANCAPLILIGPEGGFSAAEVALLGESGCRAVKLANYILRTETAALVAAAQLTSLLEAV